MGGSWDADGEGLEQGQGDVLNKRVWQKQGKRQTGYEPGIKTSADADVKAETSGSGGPFHKESKTLDQEVSRRPSVAGPRRDGDGEFVEKSRDQERGEDASGRTEATGQRAADHAEGRLGEGAIPTASPELAQVPRGERSIHDGLGKKATMSEPDGLEMEEAEVQDEQESDHARPPGEEGVSRGQDRLDELEKDDAAEEMPKSGPDLGGKWTGDGGLGEERLWGHADPKEIGELTSGKGGAEQVWVFGDGEELDQDNPRGGEEGHSEPGSERNGAKDDNRNDAEDQGKEEELKSSRDHGTVIRSFCHCRTLGCYRCQTETGVVPARCLDPCIRMPAPRGILEPVPWNGAVPWNAVIPDARQAPAPAISPSPPPSSIIGQLLRTPRVLVDPAGPGIGLPALAGLTLLGALIYGVVVGSFARGSLLWMVPLKLTGGLLISGLICTPSLYVLSVMAGADLRPRQLLTVLGGILALTTLLLLSFAPVAWVFSESSSSVGFVGFLHWLLWLVSVSFGLRLGRTCLSSLGAENPGTFVIWSVIFLLVTFQMATALRPWLGKSDTIFAQEKISFLGHWGDAMSVRPSPQPRPDSP